MSWHELAFVADKSKVECASEREGGPQLDCTEFAASRNVY